MTLRLSPARAASRRHCCIALALAIGGLPAVVLAQAVRPDAQAANGVVRSSAIVGNTLYLGGDFTWVGYPTGPCALVDHTSALPLMTFPVLPSGSIVNVAIPDGSGGWYVGGEFTAIGGVPKQNLAHILANNTVASWGPDPDGPVNALVLRGLTLVVGGNFTSIGGALRNNLATVSTSGTGTATSWNPNPDGVVLALAANATTIFAGGVFTTVAGSSHFSLAAIDATSGAASVSWAPQVFGSVH